MRRPPNHFAGWRPRLPRWPRSARLVSQGRCDSYICCRCHPDEDDSDLEYLQSHREAQLARLEGHGQSPTISDLSRLACPHCAWRQDRDRIVLLHEYILHSPPDGSFDWERGVCARVGRLWSDGRAGTCDTLMDGRGTYSPCFQNRMGWRDFACEEAPGWRMLSSLPSCPNSHMRFPMSRELLARVRECATE